MIASKDDFISVGKVLGMINKDTGAEKNKLAEKDWNECLDSAKCGCIVEYGA